MATTLLKLSCPDSVGLLARISSWVAEQGGNLVEVHQFTDPDQGWFFTRMEIDTATLRAPLPELRAAFTPLGAEPNASRVGLLHVPMDARFIINDGQHRRAAIEVAIRERPELGDESIAVVFFIDRGLERCQQLFADLNRYAIRPTKSIGVLYDHRDDMAQLARLVVLKSRFFGDLVEMERSSLSARSRKVPRREK